MAKHTTTQKSMYHTALLAVARLKLRNGWSARQITEALAREAECLNPQTGKPWALATVKRDLQYLEARWREEAQHNFASLRGEQLAALREVRAAAWEKDDLSAALQALKTEIALCGTQAPKKLARTNARGEDWMSLSEARVELARMLGVESEQLPD